MNFRIARKFTNLLLLVATLLLGACTTTDEYGVGVDKKQPTRLANPRS